VASQEGPSCMELVLLASSTGTEVGGWISSKNRLKMEGDVKLENNDCVLW
jgi:hypothetical protein